MLVLLQIFYYTCDKQIGGEMMSVAYEVKPALRKILNNDEEAEVALIELINQIVAAQRNGYERVVEAHLQAIRDWINRRFEVADERQKLTSQEFAERLKQVAHELKLTVNQLLTEADAKNEQRLGEVDIKNEKRFGEADVKNEQRFGEMRLSFEKRFNEAELNNQRRFAEAEAKSDQRTADIKVYFEKRFGELEVKSAERQASLMKWMITFFVGLLFTLAGLMLAYLKLIGKP
jgi:hypothetical protein